MDTDGAQLSWLRKNVAQAAYRPELWLPTLARLAQATGSSRAELVGFGPTGHVFSWITDTDETAWKEYLSVDGADPSVNFRLAAGLRSHPGRIVDESDYAAIKPQLRSRDYLEYCDRWGMTHGCQTTLAMEDDFLVGMSLLRSQRDGPTGQAQRHLFAAIIPHVRDAIRSQSALAEQGFHLVAGTLEAITAPAFILDAFGYVRRLTPDAEQLAATGDRLRLVGRRLRSVSHAEDVLLSLAVSRAAKQAPEAGSQAAVLVLKGEDGQAEPLVLDILPMPAEPLAMGFGPRVLVVARPAERARRKVAALLAKAYGLTAAEADIAEQLARGVSRDDIAAARGVALSTVRVQIKAIFRKLDVSREGELIARVNLFR